MVISPTVTIRARSPATATPSNVCRGHLRDHLQVDLT
jgi:hypothetical protein